MRRCFAKPSPASAGIGHPNSQRRDNESKASQGTSHTNIKQLVHGIDWGSQANECAKCACKAGSWKEVGRAGVNSVKDTSEVMTHFVSEQNSEQRKGKWQTQQQKLGVMKHSDKELEIFFQIKCRLV